MWSIYLWSLKMICSWFPIILLRNSYVHFKNVFFVLRLWVERQDLLTAIECMYIVHAALVVCRASGHDSIVHCPSALIVVFYALLHWGVFIIWVMFWRGAAYRLRNKWHCGRWRTRNLGGERISSRPFCGECVIGSLGRGCCVNDFHIDDLHDVLWVECAWSWSMVLVSFAECSVLWWKRKLNYAIQLKVPVLSRKGEKLKFNFISEFFLKLFDSLINSLVLSFWSQWPLAIFPNELQGSNNTFSWFIDLPTNRIYQVINIKSLDWMWIHLIV